MAQLPLKDTDDTFYSFSISYNKNERTRYIHVAYVVHPAIPNVNQFRIFSTTRETERDASKMTRLQVVNMVTDYEKSDDNERMGMVMLEIKRECDAPCMIVFRVRIHMKEGKIVQTDNPRGRISMSIPASGSMSKVHDLTSIDSVKLTNSHEH